VIFKQNGLGFSSGSNSLLSRETLKEGNGKVKLHPRTGHESLEWEWKYNCTLLLTLALNGRGWSKPCCGRFTSGKGTLYPLCRRLGCPQGWYGQVQKLSPHQDFITGLCRYTEYTILAHVLNGGFAVFE
jgi:hypothetical protein